MTIGYIKSDFEGNFYVIPESLTESFEELVCIIDDLEEYCDDWYCFNEEFNNKFSTYIVEGGLGNYKVIISE